MRYRLVIPYWELSTSGGIEKRILELCEYAIVQQLDADILILLKRKVKNQPKLAKNFQKLQIKYYPYSSQSYFDYLWWMLFECHAFRPTHFLAFMDRFVVVGALYKLSTLLTRQKCKFLVSQEIFFSKHMELYGSHLWKFIATFSYRCADNIVVLNSVIKDDLINTLGLSSRKIKIIPTWTKSVNCVQKALSKTKKWDFIFLGRLEKEKRVSQVISSLAALKEKGHRPKMVVVGDGSLTHSLKKESKTLKLDRSVKFAGQTVNPMKYIAASRVLVLYSLNEGHPLAVIESAMQSVPAIVSDFAGSKDVVKDRETGLIVGDAEELTTAMESSLERGSQFTKMGQNAKKYAIDKFGYENISLFVNFLFK